MASETPLIFDAGDDTFDDAVLARSNEVPVVVDFWAEWCGPCQALGPILEQMTREANGAFVLAKVDTDRNPRLASQFNVRSIPMVLGFRAGKAVASFLGPQPEPAIRDFLAQLLPSPADEKVAAARAARDAGNLELTQQNLQDALALDPRCDAALLALGEIFFEAGKPEDAVPLLERILPGTEEAKQGDRLLAAIRLQSAPDTSADELRARLDRDSDDHEARLAFAQLLAAGESYADSLEQLLELVRRDRSFQDDAGRKAMLDIFDLLGGEHPLTEKYRGELAKVLFS